MGKYKVIDDQETVLKKFKMYMMCGGIYLKNFQIYKIHIWTVSLIMLFAESLMIYSIYLYSDNIATVAILTHHTMLVFDVQIAMIVFYRERPKVQRILEDLSKSHDYQSQIMSDITIAVQENRIKNMNIISKIIVSVAFYMILNLIVGSYIEIRLGTTEYMLMYPCWFPFSLEYIVNHIIAYVFEFLMTIFIAAAIYSVLAFVYLIYNHLSSEFELLAMALERATDRATELMESNKNRKSNKMGIRDAYITSIKHCGEHHVEITKYFQDARDVNSYVFLAVLITALVVNVAAGFAFISDNNAIILKFIGVTTIQMVYLYFIFWFGQEIAEKSERIRLVIYGVPWYDMPKECRSTLCLMTERSLQPLFLISASGHTVDLETYMSVVKASYSYFNMMVAANG